MSCGNGDLPVLFTTPRSCRYEFRNSTRYPFCVLRRVNPGTSEERTEKSAVVEPNDTLQLNLAYTSNADLFIELSDGRTSTPFLPEASKDGNEVVKFADSHERGLQFEAFELVFVERGGSHQAEGASEEDIQRARSFTIGVQHCGKRAPFRFENICDGVTCEFWQMPRKDAKPASPPDVIKLKSFTGVNWAPDDSSVRNQKVVLRLKPTNGESKEVAIGVDVDCQKIVLGSSTVFVVAHTDTSLQCRRIFLAPSIGRARLYAGETEFVPSESLESSTSIHVDGVGVSVVATTGSVRELMYIKLSTLGVTQEVTTHYQKLNFTMKDLQIDNCDREALHPVLLHRDLRANQQHPVVRFTQITKRGHMGGEQALGPLRLVHQQSGRYLHSHKKNIRGPFYEVVVVDHKDENNIFTISDVNLASMRTGDGSDTIRYGDTIQLKHQETGAFLHSHHEERQQGNQYEVNTLHSILLYLPCTCGLTRC